MSEGTLPSQASVRRAARSPRGRPGRPDALAPRGLLRLAAWLVAGAVAAAANLAALPHGDFAHWLVPTFAPPVAWWLIGNAMLHLLVCLAAWWVGTATDAPADRRSQARLASVAVLALGALWPLLLWPLQAPWMAFATVSAQWLAMVAAVLALCGARPHAGWLLTPAFLWVSFGVVLMGSVWLMNR